MKKWGFLFLMVCCLCIVVIKMNEDKVEIQRFNQEFSNEYSEKTEISREQIYQGNLLLVNNEFPIHRDSIKTDIVNLFGNEDLTKGFQVLKTDISLSEDVARKFSEMVLTAKKEGVRNFSISSGFRNFEEQHALYEEMGADYALPAGYSEHNLGLSLDVGSTQMTMDKALEGKWIENNAWKYGFILRYPKDKTEVTGIQYEPWHIRYVGLPHSAIMKEKNFALEEYLDYLKREKNISASVNGKKYTISYYPINQSVTIDVPVDQQYEISGDNMGGVIVTVQH
ncbi:VanY-A/VanY-F/VanY-M family D-Ala-D-Ala carboxypeptidase [Sutcliffiella halmapala]|uniref:VanY-A/VanY-F/VanY-M family D-Ala-D-Ala carboxypeptidase n=1 Tax=Sutcliffiella halmapala TaxID=79882 RepID=UPI000995B48A|nr:VanY-A/VanY-F/VanY-M family D-Ala-D-Ala carboxypeptidase [Sutcliffiella halmapala]